MPKADLISEGSEDVVCTLANLGKIYLPAVPGYAVVRIADSIPVVTIADGYTDDSGKYSIILPDPPYKTLRVFVRAETKPAGKDPVKDVFRAVKVQNGVGGSNLPYFRSFTPNNAAPAEGYSGMIAADFTIGKANPMDLANADKAFWVYDAAVTASRMHARLPGVSPGRFPIDFPAPSAGKVFDEVVKAFGVEPTSWTLDEIPHILNADFDDWDTIIHEYAHAIAQQNKFFPFTAAKIFALQQPAQHDTGVNNRVKNSTFSFFLNNQLAFSEGFADFFSMLAQTEEYTPKVQVVSGANASAVSGDGTYHGLTVESGLPIQEPIIDETDPANPVVIRQSIGRSSGEDEELTVMRVLWDLYDTPKSKM